MLTQENTALIVVDVQGKLAHLMYEKERLFENLGKLIRGIRVLRIPIIVTEQLPEKLGATIPEIAELVSDIEPIRKSTFSCCGSESFMNVLRSLKRRQILLAGIEAHVCVYQTAMDLLNVGHVVHLVADAVSSRTAMNRQIGVERIIREGAKLTSTEMALFELLRVAEGDAFKQILQIVK
ncbi:MAG: hydrolase [Acidobacteria bacterium]|nr:MAG: hydrolase [Acidobacteriota bacterium]